MTTTYSHSGALLIVDDEEELLKIHRILLSELTPYVYTASNAQEGLALLLNIQIDTIMADMIMPGMDGMSFLQAARDMHCFAPFVFFTGNISDETKINALEAGAFSFIDKPCDNEVLLNEIKRALEFGLSQRNKKE